MAGAESASARARASARPSVTSGAEQGLPVPRSLNGRGLAAGGRRRRLERSGACVLGREPRGAAAKRRSAAEVTFVPSRASAGATNGRRAGRRTIKQAEVRGSGAGRAVRVGRGGTGGAPSPPSREPAPCLAPTLVLPARLPSVHFPRRRPLLPAPPHRLPGALSRKPLPASRPTLPAPCILSPWGREGRGLGSPDLGGTGRAAGGFPSATSQRACLGLHLSPQVGHTP